MLNQLNIDQARDYIHKVHGVLPVPPKSYLVLFSPRSGSNLLCSYLERAGLGRPVEAFHTSKTYRAGLNWKIDFADPFAYLFKAIEYQTIGGVLGMKLNFGQFELFLRNARALLEGSGIALGDHELVEVFFPGVKYIHIQRKGKIKQAISETKALQTGVWLENEEGTPTIYTALYDREHIERCFDFLLAEDVAWEYYLSHHQLPYLLVWYEDLVEEPEIKMHEIYQYLDFSGKELAPSPLRRQSNLQSSAWEKRFREETAWLQENNLEAALAEGDLTGLLVQRCRMVFGDRQVQRFWSMPATRSREIRSLFFRGKRKVKKILHLQA